MRDFEYYDLRKHWTKRVLPHLQDPGLNKVLVRDFNRYALWPFLPGDYPYFCDNLDWRREYRGRHPRYWKYVCAGACHWLVNHALRLATLAEPGRGWRIVTSPRHSTVWDGGSLLFDYNYLAFAVPPGECYRRARRGGEVLPAGVERDVGIPLERGCKRKSRTSPPWVQALRDRESRDRRRSA